jgi:hypothetical protein
MLLYSQMDLAEAPMYIVSVMSWIIDLILMLDSSNGIAWGPCQKPLALFDRHRACARRTAFSRKECASTTAEHTSDPWLCTFAEHGGSLFGSLCSEGPIVVVRE